MNRGGKPTKTVKMARNEKIFNSCAWTQTHAHPDLSLTKEGGKGEKKRFAEMS